MDPPTHGLLGAVIGQAFFGRTLGRRALVWGAVGGMLPDVDVVMTAAGPMGDWLYHRGLTHALWVPPVAGAILGTVLARRSRARAPNDDTPAAHWRWLFVLTILSHPLLDLCTTYGTVLLAPFSSRRFAIDAIAIIDPVYSALLAAALVLALGWGVGARSAHVAAASALAFSTAYLVYGLVLNHEAERLASAQLVEEGIRPERMNAYPTLLQLYLRRLVARDGDEIRVGWISLWNPRRVEWASFRQAEGVLVDQARQTREGRLFEWFTAGQNAAAVESSPRAAMVEIDDLRFGFPSEPRHGLWGIRVRFDAEGHVVPPVERVDRPLPRAPKALLLQIWRDTFVR
jgi:inner membrane protein